MPAMPDILVNAGLVETRDPTLFKMGELIRAQDAYYRPSDDAIRSVLGNAEFNSTPVGESIIGLRYLEYDGAPDVLVISTGDTIQESPAGLTGAFTSVVAGLTATGVETFDSCHYNNNHLLFDGVNRNRVRQSDGTYRFQGMLENTDPPLIGGAVGVGPGFILALGTTLTYWVEEQVRDANNIILRRNATPSRTQTITITGTGATIKPRVFRPPIVNPDATHWGLYVTATNGLFPIGVCLSIAPIATIFIDDTRSSFILPTPTQSQFSGGNLGKFASAIINLTNQQALAAAAVTPLSGGLPTGEIYETIAVSIDNLVIISSKNGPPPICTSADVQEDSIVMNDVRDRSKVWFTFSDQLDVVPYTNFIRFETKDADEVQWVRFLGRGTIVALRNTLWRIDTLPQPSDASFQISRVKVQIEGAHGGIGALTVAPFSFGQRNLLAYASRAGIFLTDGETWSLLTSDIDFERRVDVTQLDTAILVDNPQQFRLEFTYTPPGGAHNSETIFLHYHPSHTKSADTGEQMVNVTGTIRRGANAKVLANVNNTNVIFSAQSNGKVYQEWTGFTNLLGDIQFDILTGDKFPFGVGKKASAGRTWTHHQAGGATQTATMYIVQRTEGLDDEEEARQIPLKRREHSSMYAHVEGECFQFGVRATNPTTQIAIDFFVPDFDDAGEASSDGEA